MEKLDPKFFNPDGTDAMREFYCPKLCGFKFAVKERILARYEPKDGVLYLDCPKCAGELKKDLRRTLKGRLW